MRIIACAIVALSLVSGHAALGQQTLKREIAKRYYKLGEKLYEASNYPDALAKFQKAYKLAPMPALLFNIARCHEVMAELEQAIKYYEQYLEEKPQAKNRDLVQNRLVNLRQRLAARKARAPQRPPTPSAPPATSQPASRPTSLPSSLPIPQPPGGAEPRSRWKRTTGWITLGVGVAALGTGLVLGGLAQGKAEEYTDAAVPQQKMPFQDLEDIRRSGESLEGAQIMTLIIGGVVTAAGGALLLWDHLERPGPGSDDSVSARVLPYFTASGGGLAGQLEF